MVEIIRSGTIIAMTDCPRWISMQANGCYGLSDKEDAAGIVVDGSVYHLSGRVELPGAKGDVMVLETDAGAHLLGSMQGQATLEEAVCEQDVQFDRRFADLEAAVCELDMAQIGGK